MLPLEFTHTYICILRERERERVMSKTPKVRAIIDDYNLIFYWLIIPSYEMILHPKLDEMTLSTLMFE